MKWPYFWKCCSRFSVVDVEGRARATWQYRIGAINEERDFFRALVEMMQNSLIWKSDSYRITGMAVRLSRPKAQQTSLK